MHLLQMTAAKAHPQAHSHPPHPPLIPGRVSGCVVAGICGRIDNQLGWRNRSIGIYVIAARLHRRIERWEGWTRTTMGEATKHQQQEGTHLDNGPDDPLTGGEPSLDLTGGRDDQPGGATGGGVDDRRGGGERATMGGGGWGSSALDGQEDA